MDNKPRTFFPGLIESLVLLVPFAVWLFLFHHFLFADGALYQDAPAYYYKFKYYIDNIMRGVYPLWNPFLSWGMPDNFDVRFFGEFNPLFYLIIPFYKAGVPFRFLLGVILASAYWVGLLGFYALARFLLADRVTAIVAYVLLMFSSLSMVLLNDPVLILMMMPTGWFFFFVLSFLRRQRKEDMLGATFAAMLLEITYIPFYFLTLLIFFLLFAFPLFLKEIKPLFRRACSTLWTYKKTTLFCLVALILASIPGYLWYHSAGQGETVIWPFRHSGAADQHPASVGFDIVNQGGCGAVNMDEIFSNLGYLYLGDPLVLYIPAFCFLLFLFCPFTPANKRLTLIFACGISLIFLALGNLTPVYPFFFQHLYFFRLFRNIYYFMYFAFPLVVLFAVEQMRLSLEGPFNPQNKKPFVLAAAFFLFVACLVALSCYVQNPLTSTCMTVAGTFLVLIFYQRGWLTKNSPFFLLCVMALIMVEPMEVFTRMARNSHAPAQALEIRPQVPRFSFTRPEKGEDEHFRFPGISNPKKLMEDASGFALLDGHYLGTTWSYFLHENIDHTILKTYVKNKFLVYDHVRYMAEDAPGAVAQIAQAFERMDNVAFVSDPQAADEHIPAGQTRAHVITQDTAEFRVLAFDVNGLTVETNFPSAKFLVYNDSYQKAWQAFINGKEVQVRRANVAFKGIRVPAGKQIILFRYGGLGLRLFYPFMILFFFGFFFYLTGSFIRLYFSGRGRTAS